MSLVTVGRGRRSVLPGFLVVALSVLMSGFDMVMRGSSMMSRGGKVRSGGWVGGGRDGCHRCVSL
jgi:hypothetical protein